jgi:small subunit ribosomal protein S8
MSLSDPIADMLTRLRNALRSRHKTVNVRASKVCSGACQVLKDEGYIEDFTRIEDGKQGLLRVYLKYGPMGQDVVTELRRVSRPGRRVYRGVDDLPKPINGLGIAVVSTSQGVLSDRQCRQKNIGGEVLCEIV